MTDIVDKNIRSRMMSGIKSKNTKPELLIRKALFSRGFRYRLHDSRLPGKPDLVFLKYRAVILINGCFWHRHECHLFKWPSSRPDFWRKKLEGNYSRDQRNLQLLHSSDWRTLVIWECAIKGKQRLLMDVLADQITHWLTDYCPSTDIPEPRSAINGTFAG
tara:strand:+ start:9197 stop:9679 length:483 start_codon:yes stop_codon:yes gene_type:complete